MQVYHLAFIIEKYFPFGGLQRDMRRFALACAARGHRVTVFTTSWEGDVDEPLTVKIIDIRAATNHGKMKKLERFVAGLQQEKRHDCICGFNRVGHLDVYFAGDVCLAARLKREGRWHLRFLPRYRHYLQLERHALADPSQTEIMVISTHELAAIAEQYPVDPGRLHLLPPGVDKDAIHAMRPDAEARSRFRRKYAIPEDGWMILSVGSSYHTKGVDRALAAIAALPESLRSRCTYLVVGKGKPQAILKEAQKAGMVDRIRFVGGRNDIGKFYYGADLLLHPARVENTGLVLLEAMTAGLPVLASSVCGYAHYIADADAGKLWKDPFCLDQLTSSLQQMLNRETLQHHQRQALSYCASADLYSMTEHAVALILACAHRHGRNG